MTAISTCLQCVAYNEQLNRKADEIKTLEEHVLKLAHKLQDESRRKEEAQERLSDKVIRLNDYAIKIREGKNFSVASTVKSIHSLDGKKSAIIYLLNIYTGFINMALRVLENLEEQLQSATDRRPISELSRAEVDSIIGRDLERIHSQLIEKDMKIMELSDIILEKEGHIIELQEMCHEQGELMQAKARAFHIIQQKLLDLGTRTTREDSTETDAGYVFESSFSPLSSLQQQQQKDQRHQNDSILPGHAVVHFKMGQLLGISICLDQIKGFPIVWEFPTRKFRRPIGSSGSPPPVDPSEEYSSIIEDDGKIQDDLDANDVGNASSLYKKKHRKKVTFDLPPRKELGIDNGQEEGDDIMQAFIDVTAENDQLRQTIQEMEKCASNSQNHLSQLHTQLDEMRRDCRNQVLKARASMQGKIRDLEDKISAMNTGHTNKIEHLNANIETLRADREWTLEENARLLKLLDSYKQKLSDAWETMGARQEENKKLRSKLDNDRVLIVQLADDLEEAQQTANILLEQKISVLDDVERLKEALEAQDQYIELLEKDTVIYEEHVGLLRDSLGTSKAERKALIRSKAYEAKLRALEREKEQMNRRSNGKTSFENCVNTGKLELP
uniref:Coiled-coil domain-containing protein n=1 Tax=Loa loa TaxID=7209 RepID=A0A1I7VLN6_LOALO